MIIEKSEAELSVVSRLWSFESSLLPLKSTKILVIEDSSCVKISNWLLGMFLRRLNSHLLNIYTFWIYKVEYADDVNQHSTRKLKSITSF